MAENTKCVGSLSTLSYQQWSAASGQFRDRVFILTNESKIYACITEDDIEGQVKTIQEISQLLQGTTSTTTPLPLNTERDVGVIASEKAEDLSIEQLRFANLFLTTKNIYEYFHKIMGSNELPSDPTHEIIQSIIEPTATSPLLRSEEYLPSILPYYSMFSKKTERTIVVLLIRVAMLFRPQYFQNPNNAPVSLFLKEIAEEKVDDWAKKGREIINEKEDETPEGKAAAHKFLDGLVWIAKYIGSAKVYDPTESPLNQGIDSHVFKRLEILEKWLRTTNSSHPDYNKYYREYRVLDQAARKIRDQNLQQGGSQLVQLTKDLDPSLQDVESMEEMAAQKLASSRNEQRQAFETYVQSTFPQKNWLEPNKLRQFWEEVYRKRYGPIFYELVSESLDLTVPNTSLHQTILQLWYLSLIDTMNVSPKEARSRMPQISWVGHSAPNYGYDMAHSEAYHRWLANPLTRTAGDMIMDHFWWLVDWGLDLDIDQFIRRFDEYLFSDEEDEGIAKFIDNATLGDTFIIPLAFHLLTERYGKPFIADGNHSVVDELIQASKEVLSEGEDPISHICGDLEAVLLELKTFAENMNALKDSGTEGTKNPYQGLVFGIGFNGDLFSVPPLKEREEENQVWLGFAKSGRGQAGALPFLRLLEKIVTVPSTKICAKILDPKNISTYLNQYRSLILQQIEVKLHENQQSLKRLWDANMTLYLRNQKALLESLKVAMESKQPFENFNEAQQKWVLDLANWYKIPCKLSIAHCELTGEEQKIHESAREVFLHAAVKRSFTLDHPELIPWLKNHWKPELLEAMNQLGKDHLSEKEELLLIDSFAWSIHPTLDEVSTKLILPKLETFLQSKITEAKKPQKGIEKTLKQLKNAKPKDENGRNDVAQKIVENQSRLNAISATVQELESPVANWSTETFEAFKTEFFKGTNVGQCIEPLFASKIGHDFFFPVYLSANNPAMPIPMHDEPNIGLSLGNKHPKFVIPPCNKNCQIHALAHLYVSDLTREHQSIDLLNQWRTVQALPPAIDPILSLDELKRGNPQTND